LAGALVPESGRRACRSAISPDAPADVLFDPGHADEVEALPKKTIGERTITAIGKPV